MEILIIVAFLGIFTYFILKRNVANITRTPLWILWIVIMTPGLIWGVWNLVYGKKTPLPLGLMIIAFIISSILYVFLIQAGQISNNSQTKNPLENLEETENNPEFTQIKITPITPGEEVNLRSCFAWNIFYLDKLEYRPEAILCLGNLRTNADSAYETIKQNIERFFGDRFFIIFQESASGKPFFALVPKQPQNKINDEYIKGILLAITMVIISLLTATIGGVKLAGLPGNKWDMNLVNIGLPYAISLISILGMYEISQYVCAKLYKMKITLPYFIPFPPFSEWNMGTLGAFVQRRSPFPHRRALFDFAIVGVITGLILSLLLLFWGLSHSEIVTLSKQSGIFNFNSFNPRFSLFLAFLSKLALKEELTAKSAINLHPVAMAGYIGFIWTVFKLLPIGRLDGGQIVHAIFGQRKGMIIGQITWLLIVIRAFITPEFLIVVIVLLFIPLTDEPALNDVSDLNNGRDFLGLAILAVLVSILLPTPESIIRLLQI